MMKSLFLMKKQSYKKKKELINTINDEDLDQFKRILFNYPELIHELKFQKKRSLLHSLCENNKCEFVDFLLNQGFDPNIKDRDGITPFLLTSSSQLLKIFLKYKRTDVHHKCNKGNNILHYIALRVYDIDDDEFGVLIERNININEQNNDQQTPLHLCCIAGNTKLALQILNQPNVNINIKNNNNECPMDLAKYHNQKNIVKLIRNIEIRNKGISTPVNSVNSVSKSAPILKRRKRCRQILNRSCNSLKFKTYKCSSNLCIACHNNNGRFDEFLHIKLSLLEKKKVCFNDTNTQKLKYKILIINEIVNELEDILCRNFVHDISERILDSKSFIWKDDFKSNKLEVIKSITEFLIGKKKLQLLDYLYSQYNDKIEFVKYIYKDFNMYPIERIEYKLKNINYNLKFQWEYNINEINLGNLIGEGSFGSVFEGSLISNGKTVAIKMFSDLTHNSISSFYSELSIQKDLSHPNIIGFIGACMDVNLILITEYASEGNLSTYLKNNNVSWETKLKIVYDIALGMEYLHSRPTPIIHRDLKCQNILLTKDMEAKISDFGLSKFEDGCNSQVGTLNWLAPEALEGEQKCSTFLDVYSFGMVMYEILMDGRCPYSEMEAFEVIRAINEGKRPDIPDTCDKDYANLIKKCWNDIPNLRPSFSDILISLELILKKYL